MPPRRRAPTPIPIDVEAVRRKLAEGKIVRVGISRSAQFPEGGTGRVRRVGDPAVDGEEFIQVELTLNGTKDTLPFTPADLTPATRHGARGRSQPGARFLSQDRGGAAGPGAAAAPVGVRCGGSSRQTRSSVTPVRRRLPTGPPEIVVTASNPPPAHADATGGATGRAASTGGATVGQAEGRSRGEASRRRSPSRSPPPTPIHLNGGSRPGSGSGSCSAPDRSHRPGSGTWSACWTTRR